MKNRFRAASGRDRVLVILLLIHGGMASPAAGSEVPNRSFEDWQGDAPIGWRFDDDQMLAKDDRLRGDRARDDQEAHSGSASIRISALRAGTTLTTTATFPVKPGENYLVSVWTQVNGDFHYGEIGSHWEKPTEQYPLGPHPHPGGTQAHFEAHHAIHRRGGIVGFTHPNISHNPATELPFDLLAGPTFDAFDIMTTGVSANNEKSWYLILNHGYRMPCTGTSDSMMDTSWAASVGVCRTYAYLGDRPLSIANFAAAIKAGRTFATSGPMLEFTIDGEYPGMTFKAGSQPHTVKIWARSEADPRQKLNRVELVRNGEVVKTFKIEPDDPREFMTELVIDEADNAWYIVRCVGVRWHHAVSSPIYFRKADYEPPQPSNAHVTFNITSADGTSITARVQTFNYGKRIRTFTAENGRLTCEVPPTAWFEVLAANHEPARRSIFFDVPEIYQASTHAGLSLEQKNTFLTTWEPYEKIARLLQDIRFEIPLELGKRIE